MGYREWSKCFKFTYSSEFAVDVKEYSHGSLQPCERERECVCVGGRREEQRTGDLCGEWMR